MKESYKIEKDLEFTSNISEIISISLEEKHEVNDNTLKGNFIVSGEYKIHEISINKESFNYKIPFNHEIGNDIDLDSLNLEITNFTYDNDNDSLFVTIDYDVVGERKDILIFDDKEDLDDFLNSREVEVIIDDVKNEIDETLEKEDVIDEINKEINIDDVPNIIEERIPNKEDIINNIPVEDNIYITYKIHIVKSNDTLESICLNHNISLDELKEYNKIDTLKLGDKLIIPVVNER